MKLNNSKLTSIFLAFMLAFCMIGCSDEECSNDAQTPSFMNSIDKPVIYLYGYDDEQVEVNVKFDGTIDCVYPKMTDNRWKVKAQKDGTLKVGSKEYRYLFWEGSSDAKFDFSEGYCIKGDKTEKFLDESLTMLGLTDKEKNDFIVYWLPRMKKNPYNVISFQSSAYTDISKLNVDPAPNTTVRIFMAYYPSDEEVEIKSQKLQTGPSRDGKTVVEWGGTQVDPESLKSEGSILNGFESISDEALIEKLASMSSEELQAVLTKTVEKKQENGDSNLLKLQEVKGHEYIDKNGDKYTFTEDEWDFLQKSWAYTGQPNTVIAQFTINELNAYIKNNMKR